MRFGSGDGPTWPVLRITLAEKFGVLPSEVDKMSYPEIVEVIHVMEGKAKAEGLFSDRR